MRFIISLSIVFIAFDATRNSTLSMCRRTRLNSMFKRYILLIIQYSGVTSVTQIQVLLNIIFSIKCLQFNFQPVSFDFDDTALSVNNANGSVQTKWYTTKNTYLPVVTFALSTGVWGSHLKTMVFLKATVVASQTTISGSGPHSEHVLLAV